MITSLLMLAIIAAVLAIGWRLGGRAIGRTRFA